VERRRTKAFAEGRTPSSVVLVKFDLAEGKRWVRTFNGNHRELVQE
jgi:hypothetical protein